MNITFEFRFQGTCDPGYNEPSLLVYNSETMEEYLHGGIEFGEVVVNNSKTMKFIIENHGDQPLHLTGNPLISLTGNDASDFTVTSPPPSLIPAGGYDFFEITFNSSSTGTKNATITIESDASSSPYTKDITASCVQNLTPPPAEVKISYQGNVLREVENFASDILGTDFGSCAVGSQITHTFLIENTGGQVVTFRDIHMNSQTDFTFSFKTLPFDLQPGASENLTVTFQPQAIGDTDDMLFMDFSNGAFYGWQLAGVGIAQQVSELTVKGNNLVITNNDISPNEKDHTDFGSMLPGTTVSYTYTIENTGQAVLNLTGNPVVAISGTNASDFTVTAQPQSTTLQPGASDSFTIEFNASSTGTKDAAVTIESNDPGTPFTFNIAAEVTPNVYSISGTVSGDVLGGVTVSVDASHSAVTDAAGHYTITGLSDGTYTVTPTLSGYTFSPASASSTVQGADVTGVDFTSSVSGGATYSIKGKITGDVLQGVTVTAVDSNNSSLVFTAISDANGE